MWQEKVQVLQHLVAMATKLPHSPYLCLLSRITDDETPIGGHRNSNINYQLLRKLDSAVSYKKKLCLCFFWSVSWFGVHCIAHNGSVQTRRLQCFRPYTLFKSGSADCITECWTERPKIALIFLCYVIFPNKMLWVLTGTILHTVFKFQVTFTCLQGGVAGANFFGVGSVIGRR